MRTEVILKYLGFILLFNAIFLLIAFLISLIDGDSSAIPLLFSFIICVLFGFYPLIFVEDISDISFSEGIAIVVVGWLTTCVIGMMPYLMWGGEFTLINAWFESVSGFTTTGSTILNDVESLPRGLLFWRSATHWIGGVGIIIFVLLILPSSQNPRYRLLNTEMSELSKTNFSYKAKRIITILVVVYTGLTLSETLLLVIFGMPLFDAINHSFATIATGGFSTKNLSIAYYNSFSIELIVVIFMILAGIHFGLLYATFTRQKMNIFSSKMARAYVSIMFIGVLLVASKLYWEGNYDLEHSLRASLFQVVSLGSTTGFATVDTDSWPSFAKIILMFFTIQCAMVGSTSGGLKFDRIYIFFKLIGKQIKLIQHPQAIISINVDDRVVPEPLERQVLLFIVLYVFTFFVTTLILSSLNVDPMTAFSASIATIGNVGPGFGAVSSMSNYAGLPVLGKLVLTINMLLGRLEIYSVLTFLLIRRNRT